MPMLDLLALRERRWLAERRAFARRHQRVCWPAVAFVAGFLAGMALILAVAF